MLQSFALMKTEAFSWNSSKFFWSPSWYQRTLFSVNNSALQCTTGIIYYSPFGFTCCWWLDLNPRWLQFDSLQCVLAPWPGNQAGDQQCQLEEAEYNIVS